MPSGVYVRSQQYHGYKTKRYWATISKRNVDYRCASCKDRFPENRLVAIPLDNVLLDAEVLCHKCHAARVMGTRVLLPDEVLDILNSRGIPVSLDDLITWRRSGYLRMGPHDAIAHSDLHRVAVLSIYRGRSSEEIEDALQFIPYTVTVCNLVTGTNEKATVIAEMKGPRHSCKVLLEGGFITTKEK